LGDPAATQEIGLFTTPSILIYCKIVLQYDWHYTHTNSYIFKYYSISFMSDSEKKQSYAKVDVKQNRLLINFFGIISKSEMNSIYTQVRFGVSDLQPKYDVIADFSGCRFMYLNAIEIFRRIFNYILANDSGEIIRVINKRRIITKQIVNYTLRRQGYKPTYADDMKQALLKIDKRSKRSALRFQLHEKSVQITSKQGTFHGYILNISTTGCAINSQEMQPAMGENLILSFSFESLDKKDAADVFKFDTQVVRTESYAFAVQFLDVDIDTQNRLRKDLVAASDREISPKHV
jgi:hypothetical protein